MRFITRVVFQILSLGFSLLFTFIAIVSLPIYIVFMTSGIIKTIISLFFGMFVIGLGAANVLIDIDRIKEYIK